MRIERWIAGAALAVVAVGAGACDGDNAFAGPSELTMIEAAPDVTGSWTGEEELAGTNDAGGSGAGDYAYSFPVALSFEADGEFVLWAHDFPVSGGDTEDRTCRGVYEQDGRSLEFFPDDQCLALPLHRYGIGTTLPNGLVLEAESDPASGGADVSVEIVVERN